MPAKDPEARRRYLRKYYLENIEYHLRRRKEYYEANKPAIAARQTKAYQENKNGCRDRQRIHSKAWGKAHPEKRKASVFKATLKYKYGLEYAAYLKLVAEHAGKCAVCGVEGKRLSVDHSHATGAVRGLLCTQCNWALGHLSDSIPALEAAIRYLKKYGG